ncbi:MAG: membrane protein insertase YidC [Acidobacteriota bacterium]
MDIRRLLLAFVLSLGILLTWNYFFPPPEKSLSRPGSELTTVEGGRSFAADAESGTGSADAVERMEPAPGDAAAGETAAAAAEDIDASAEERLVVDGERFRATLSNRGARLTSFVLKNHTASDGERVDLVRYRENERLPFSLVDPASGEPLALDNALFAVEQQGSGDERTITFRHRSSAGTAEKRFRFRRDGIFEVAVEVERPADWSLWLGPGIRNPSPDELESRYAGERGGVYLLGEDIERVDARKGAELEALPATGLRWVGLEDHYFLTVAIPNPETPLRGVVFNPLLMDHRPDGLWAFAPVPPKEQLTKAQKDLQRDYALLLEPAGDRLEMEAFWGAKNLRRLSAMPYGLDGTVNLGMFGFLARWLFIGLFWIHENMVANWGWSIVLLTVGIKLILFPLTHKSYKSMRRMQELGPKMQSIRAKYRPKLKDKNGKPNLEMQRKMNEEIMGLYKSEGVNPAGGCLPMLLQLPVLFAFYRLLGAAVELRNAPWMLWIQDLSAPDPFYALPIIMGATQFIQQKMTPMAGDAMQRRIFQLMPVFMTFLFLGFPSGLVLYWLTNNVLTIIQQGAYNQFKKKDEPKKGAKKS